MIEYKEGVDSFMSSTGNRFSNEFKQQFLEFAKLWFEKREEVFISFYWLNIKTEKLN